MLKNSATITPIGGALHSGLQVKRASTPEIFVAIPGRRIFPNAIATKIFGVDMRVSYNAECNAHRSCQSELKRRFDCHINKCRESPRFSFCSLRV